MRGVIRSTHLAKYSAEHDKKEIINMKSVFNLSDDLISRQAAIDEMGYCQTFLFDTRDKDKKISLEDALYALERLPSADRPKWIPVIERLPEEGLTVLILAENGRIEFGQRDEDKWEWLAESIADYWTRAEGVIAWQPLPKPYKESEENGND